MLQVAKRHNQLVPSIVTGIEADVEVREARNFYRVSETTLCDRKLAYGKLGVPISNPFPARVRSKMAMGDTLHNWIRGELIPKYTPYTVTDWHTDKDQEAYLQATFPVGSTEVTFGGHLDGILRPKTGEGVSGIPPPPGKAGRGLPTKPQRSPSRSSGWVLEVKTAGDWSYHHVKQLGFADRDDYSFGYVRQANRYVALWNTLYPKDQVQGFVIFVLNTDGKEDKDTGINARDYWFEFDPELWKEDLIQRANVERQLPNLPTRRYLSVTNFECIGCTWKDICWDGYVW